MEDLVGGLISETELWSCTTCGACMEECPVVVEHVPTIIDIRRNLVLEESKIPETGMNALLSMEQRGHPWRGTQVSRQDSSIRSHFGDGWLQYFLCICISVNYYNICL